MTHRRFGNKYKIQKSTTKNYWFKMTHLNESYLINGILFIDLCYYYFETKNNNNSSSWSIQSIDDFIVQQINRKNRISKLGDTVDNLECATLLQTTITYSRPINCDQWSLCHAITLKKFAVTHLFKLYRQSWILFSSWESRVFKLIF